MLKNQDSVCLVILAVGLSPKGVFQQIPGLPRPLFILMNNTLCVPCLALGPLPRAWSQLRLRRAWLSPWGEGWGQGPLVNGDEVTEAESIPFSCYSLNNVHTCSVCSFSLVVRSRALRIEQTLLSAEMLSSVETGLTLFQLSCVHKTDAVSWKWLLSSSPRQNTGAHPPHKQKPLLVDRWGKGFLTR